MRKRRQPGNLFFCPGTILRDEDEDFDTGGESQHPTYLAGKDSVPLPRRFDFPASPHASPPNRENPFRFTRNGFSYLNRLGGI